MCPSIIHCLFLLVLVGHVLTITVSTHAKVAIDAGTVVDIPGHGRLTIQRIDLEKYPDDSLLRTRTKQVHVTAEICRGDETRIDMVKFLEPLRLGNTYLHLDLERRPKKKVALYEETTVCNRSEFSLTRHEPQVFLVITEDPGFNVIVIGFCGIIVLLVWYYLSSTRYTWFKGKNEMELENVA